MNFYLTLIQQLTAALQEPDPTRKDYIITNIIQDLEKDVEDHAAYQQQILSSVEEKYSEDIPL